MRGVLGKMVKTIKTSIMKRLFIIFALLLLLSCDKDSVIENTNTNTITNENCNCDRIKEVIYSVPVVNDKKETLWVSAFITINDCTGVQKRKEQTTYDKNFIKKIGDCL